MVVAYADASGLWSTHSTNGGVTFGSPRAVDELEAAYWVRLERRPGGEIDLAVQDESNDLRAWRWNGYDWGSTTPIPLCANLEQGSAHDVEPFALASVVPAAPPAPPLSDFNGDGKPDLLWHNGTTGALFVWFLDQQAVVGSSYLRPESFADTRWQIRALGDFSGDGKADVLWHHVATGDLYVWFLWHNQQTGELYAWLMNGTTVASGAFLTPSSPGSALWRLAEVADFDGDRKPDLLWHHKTTGELYFWFLDGLVVKGGGYLSPSRSADPKWSIAPR